MNQEMQKRIDAVNWYHEFDFGNGLAAVSKSPDTQGHRQIWNHMRSRLDSIDFAGKSVLDIGCWDGYWSFYAEGRGASNVLATDDCEQNWAGDTGLRLAKELLRSSVEINTNLSVYELTSLQSKFDIILCMGVYYHLIDPFYAFAQIRHCCHEDSIVVFEGDVRSSFGLPPGASLNYFSLPEGAAAQFRPTPAVLAGFLEAAYLRVESESFMLPWSSPTPPTSLSSSSSPNWFRRAMLAFQTKDKKPLELSNEVQTLYNRAVLICRPFRGENQCFWYRPPFGLDHYDTRWQQAQQ